MTERFKYIPLTIDNILSFEDYMPRMIQQMILRDSVSGWGVVEDDLVSGVAMVELIKDKNLIRIPGQEEDKLRILWLFVDEEVRGQGIGKELLARCIAFAEENNVMGVYSRYPSDESGKTDDFLIACGFSVAGDGREEVVEAFSESEFEPKVPLHTAWLRLKGKAQTADRQLLEESKDMGLVMPRLTSIRLYLEEMGYGDQTLIQDEWKNTVLVVARDGDLSEMMISILPGVQGMEESYVINVRGKRPYHEKPDIIASYLKTWQKSHPMTVGEINEGESCVEFSAMIPVDSGMVNEEQFHDFFTAVCGEIDSFE